MAHIIVTFTNGRMLAFTVRNSTLLTDVMHKLESHLMSLPDVCAWRVLRVELTWVED